MASVRTIAPADIDAARGLFASEQTTALFLTRAGALLDAVARGESWAFVADEGSALRGVIIFGPVAGATGTAAINALCVAPAARRGGIGAQLVSSVVEALRPHQYRLVVAELASDPRLGPAVSLFRSVGFAEEGRLKDFVSAGTDLSILALRLS